MATDYGIDVSTIGDLDVSGVNVSGPRAIAEACIRRCSTDPESIAYADATECFDILETLSEGIDTDNLYAIASKVESVCEQDERVSSVTCSVNILDEELIIKMLITPYAGRPFTLTVKADDITLTLLSLE